MEPFRRENYDHFGYILLLWILERRMVLHERQASRMSDKLKNNNKKNSQEKAE